jgi:hypothetical protein
MPQVRVRRGRPHPHSVCRPGGVGRTRAAHQRAGPVPAAPNRLPDQRAAPLLAVATDARAGRVGTCTVRSVSPDARQVPLLPAPNASPSTPAPLLRAALVDHQTRGLAGYALLTAHGGRLLLTQSHGQPHRPDRNPRRTPRSIERSDSGPEEQFAAALVNSGSVRIDGVGPSLWSDGRTTARRRGRV